MPDPRLKEAIRAINKILQQFDIAGQVTLVSKTHSEFFYKFPTWSVVQPEQGPNGAQGIRIRSFEVYYGDKEKQRVALEQSLHCLYAIRDLAGRAFMAFNDLTEHIEAESGFDITHTPFTGFEPHENEGE